MFLLQGIELHFQVVHGDFKLSVVQYISGDGIDRTKYQDKLAEFLYREKRAEAHSRDEVLETEWRTGLS
jgi:hypothetical protein